MFGRRSDEERLQLRRLVDRAERVLDLIERALLSSPGPRAGSGVGDLLGALGQAFSRQPAPPAARELQE